MVYLYAIVAGSFDLLGGWFALRVRADRIQPRYIIAFAAGVLLAVTFFDILPEDILPEVDLKSAAPFLALGFVAFYVLEKLMMIHVPLCGPRVGPTKDTRNRGVDQRAGGAGSP